jgi:undecaprenyl diphosphate synthase
MLSQEKLPKHLVLIPDGNRRWAKVKGLAPWEGHRRGIHIFYGLSAAAFRFGIPYVTLWAASEDNLTKRDPVEVKFLLTFIKNYLREELKTKRFIKEEISLQVLGRWGEILKDPELNHLIDQLADQTKSFTKHHLTILLAYDGKREMLEAIKKICSEKSPDEINYQTVKERLWTGGLPAVDFVVRTGGEPHWSAGLMMWLTTDSQFYFTPTFWPDFDQKELQRALLDYSQRERRLGK